MRLRGVAVAWVVVAVVLLILLGLELSNWRSLTTEGARAVDERRRLTDEILLREQQLVAEMRRQSAVLQEMQWSSAGGDPAAFLTRLAELAQEKKMKVIAIGPLERQSAPQFNKSSHTIQIQAPYREIRDLAARVEQEKGILEDVRLDAAPAGVPAPSAPGASPPSDEIHARFKMTVLELSEQAKRVINRAVATSGGTARAAPGAPLMLPVPTKVSKVPPLGRDPFSFLTPPRPTAVSAVSAGVVPEKPAVPLEVKGIISFPGGFLAIVNNQIAKVGDTVSGHRVERITDNSVTLREPGGAPRTIDLPELVSPPPAAPRR